jgi:DNA-directed RNA polymerase alpha subunit
MSRAKNPDFRIDMVTAARLADVVRHRLMVIPEDMVADVETMLARRPKPFDSWESVEALDLSRRSFTCLVTAGLSTVGDLTAKTADDLLAIPGFGPGCLKEVETMLAHHGRRLKGGAK